MGPFSYWEDQLETDGHGHMSGWGEDEDDSPRAALDRLISLARSNKTTLAQGTFMFGDRLVLPRDLTHAAGDYAIPIDSMSLVCRFVSVFPD